MNLSYYKDLGYDISGNYIKVNYKHLLPNCKELVKVSCDYCNHIEEIPYIKYNRSIKSIVNKYACSNCKGEKIKESNILKWGVSSVAKLESSKIKSRKTNLEKYGVEFHTQSESVKQKIKKTNLDKLGVENPMQSSLVKEKQKETILNLFGVDNISKVNDIKEKKKEKYIENFGVDHPLKSEEIKEKVKLTNKLKWGDEYISRSESWRKLNYNISKDPNYINYIKDGISLFNCNYGLDHQFEISKDVYSKRKLYGVGLCTICNPIDDLKSIKEKELHNWIVNTYNGEIIQNYRDGKMEIDVYLPELKIGFEFNGLYWHSNIYKDSTFHINKTNFFKDKEIRLIHIWEDDWNNKQDIIKSQINNWLGLTKNKIHARECEIKILDNVKDFLNMNHVQGTANSVLKLGLFYNNELVSVMTFDHFEGRKKMEEGGWNLNRFCNKIGFNIIGGSSKLLNYFVGKYKPKRIVSYADKDWSNGGLYYKLGFNLVSDTRPDYKYIIDGRRINKSRFRKSGLLDIPKIWDCGKLKFEIRY